MDTSRVTALLNKAVIDQSFQQALLANPEKIITEFGITDANQIENIKAILMPFLNMGGPSPEVQDLWFGELKEHFETLTSLRGGLRETIQQMLDGYQRTMLMYTVSFYMGIVLIVAAVIFAFLESEPLLPIVFAGLGTADIIGYFISNPPLKLQQSRADLAQLQAAYFIWYHEFRIWDAYLNTEYRRYQSRLPIEPQAAAADYNRILLQVSDVLMSSTIKMLGVIEKFVEGKPEEWTEAEDAKESESIPSPDTGS